MSRGVLQANSTWAPAGPDLLHPALSLERLELEGAVDRYRHEQARRAEGDAFDAAELLAGLLMHVALLPIRMSFTRAEPSGSNLG